MDRKFGEDSFGLHDILDMSTVVSLVISSTKIAQVVKEGHSLADIEAIMSEQGFTLMENLVQNEASEGSSNVLIFCGKEI